MNGINTWPGWHCVRQLGSGSYGNVYEIECVENGNVRRAALKVMSIPSSPEAVQDIFDAGYASTGQEASEFIEKQINIVSREFKMMSELQGRSNIVEFEDYLIIPHETWIGVDILIRMELLTPLNKYIQSHAMQDQDIVNLGIDICHALQICHTMNPPILHRDIKLANIMVDDRGNFKLGDFGIARIVDGKQYAHTRVGTVSHMAPEVYRGQGYYVAADIYSLGMVLYRLLNNNRGPFVPAEGTLTEQKYMAAENMRLNGTDISLPLRGSAALKAVVKKALAYDPYNRFQTAAEFGVALKNCSEFQNRNQNTMQRAPEYQPERSTGSSGGQSIQSVQPYKAPQKKTDRRKTSNHKKNLNRKEKGRLVIAACVGLVWGSVILSFFFVNGIMKNTAKSDNKKSIVSGADIVSKLSSFESEDQSAWDEYETNTNTVETDSQESSVSGADSVSDLSGSESEDPNAWYKYAAASGYPVCVNGEFYGSINDAITESVAVVVEVTLVGNLDESVIIPEEKDVRLNLNGYTLRDRGNHTIVNSGKLTVYGPGTVDNVTPGRAALVNRENAQAYLLGGDFLRSKESGDEKNTYYTVANFGAMRVDGCTIQNKGDHSSTLHNGWTRDEFEKGTINGDDSYAYLLMVSGCIEGGVYAVKNDLYSGMDITDGELSGSAKALIYNKAELTIENGSFRNAPVAIIDHGDGDSFVMEEILFETDEVSRRE